MKFLYCIEHDNMVKVQNSPWSILHSYEVRTELEYEEMDWCMFDMGYATCPEPEYDPDWDLNLVAPSDEELAGMSA